MRAEVSRVQRRLGVATLYVTHDQTEAMTLGDRVAVLRSGHLQQCDPPQALYDHPANMFVATFIGSPAMNLYEANLDPDGSWVRIGSQILALPERLRADPKLTAYRGAAVVADIRPEHFSDAAASSAPAAGGTDGEGHAGRVLVGDVDLIESLGAEKLVHFRLDAERIPLVGAAAGLAGDEDPAELARGEIGRATFATTTARLAVTSAVRAGQRASLVVDIDRLHLFDPTSGDLIAG
jgi:multiple sugar transport system ATP-binding protein